MPVNQVEEWSVYIAFEKPLTEKSKADIEQLIWSMYGSEFMENGCTLGVCIDGFTDKHDAEELDKQIMELVEYEE